MRHSFINALTTNLKDINERIRREDITPPKYIELWQAMLDDGCSMEADECIFLVYLYMSRKNEVLDAENFIRIFRSMYNHPPRCLDCIMLAELLVRFDSEFSKKLYHQSVKLITEQKETLADSIYSTEELLGAANAAITYFDDIETSRIIYKIELARYNATHTLDMDIYDFVDFFDWEKIESEKLARDIFSNIEDNADLKFVIGLMIVKFYGDKNIQETLRDYVINGHIPWKRFMAMAGMIFGRYSHGERDAEYPFLKDMVSYFYKNAKTIAELCLCLNAVYKYFEDYDWMYEIADDIIGKSIENEEEHKILLDISQKFMVVQCYDDSDFILYDSDGQQSDDSDFILNPPKMKNLFFKAMAMLSRKISLYEGKRRTTDNSNI